MTIKQEQFILEYLKTFNATDAAIKAGYSENTAYTIGWENLRKPEIKAAIDAKVEELTGGRHKAILANIRFWEQMRDNPESSESAQLKASELLGKFYAMFTERQEVEHSGTVEHNIKTWGEVMGGDGPEAESD